jgi:hypothetical protein
VGKWRGRFQAGHLDGLLDQPRPGAPRTISGEKVERWFATLIERQIRRGTHRSTIELEQAIRKYLDVNNRNPTPCGPRPPTRSLKASSDSASELLTQDTRSTGRKTKSYEGD